MSFRRILIALDESPHAAHAAEVGFDLARSLGAEVALVHAVDPAVGYAPDSGILPATLISEAQRDGKALLATMRHRAKLQPEPLEFVQTGRPAAEIVAAAKDWPADVIVIGSHGRSGFNRVLLGSVAEGVTRHAPCPVLVVRASE